MLKAILLFIKAHAVATAITTTAVVTTAVATPIAVSNYTLDKNVKDNLNMLVSSDFQINTYNQIAKNNQTAENNQITEDNQTTENNQVQNETKPVVNTEEPLKFRIEKVYNEDAKNSIDYTQGDKAINDAKSRGVEYKIVPSYDKDFSKWTKQEKEEYQKALEDIRKMAEEEYNKVAENEKQILENLQNEFEKEEASWSEYYTCVSGAVSYNSYTKKYKGSYTSKVIETVHDDGQHSYDYKKEFFGNISADEFRNVIYPIMLKTYEESKKMGLYDAIPEEEKLYRANLEKVYHLSD